MATGTLEESAKFAAKLIRKNPDISMAELKKAAKPHGIRIYPLAIGKAKVSLGLGRPKTRRKVTRKRGTGKRGPGRPRKAADPAAALSQIASQMRELERENAALRKALAKVADAVSGF